jgi:hypothetical protein
MGMTLAEIASECQQRSGDDPDPDRAHAYGYVAHYVRDRPMITLEQLARDLDLWISVHERSAGRYPAQSDLHVTYKHQSAVYQEVLAWAKGEGSGSAQGLSGEEKPR